jgi:hypothetical protein
MHMEALNMPRTCTICTHPDRAEIDTAIATCRASIRDIASRYRVTKDALRRHRDTHLSTALVRAAERQREQEDDTLLGRVDHVWRVLKDSLGQAHAAKQFVAVPAIAGQAHKNIELKGQLTGELNQAPPTANVTLTFPIPDGGRRPQHVVCEPAPPALPEPRDEQSSPVGGAA